MFSGAPPPASSSEHGVDVVTVPSLSSKEKVPLVAANSEAMEKPSSSGNMASEAVRSEEKPESAAQPLVASITEEESDATIQERV